MRVREGFFRMTIMIGDEMAEKTKVFDLQNREPFVLDLCMAPGGFTKSVMKRLPNATVHAMTLPPESGGHQIMVKDANLTVVLADITMYAAEFGVENVPSDHPDATTFSMDRPYSNSRYDLVFCGGAVLRTHKRAEYRDKVEAVRLTLSQLILALQRIRTGGTLVLLLHRVEIWETVQILHTLSSFANIQLFKPRKAHALKSSFYVIAKTVQPLQTEAMEAVAEWKRRWYEMTFEVSQDDRSHGILNRRGESKDASLILEEFGPRLIQLGRPIWSTQAKALEKSEFLRQS